jgi:hypothetical protein
MITIGTKQRRPDKTIDRLFKIINPDCQFQPAMIRIITVIMYWEHFKGYLSMNSMRSESYILVKKTPMGYFLMTINRISEVTVYLSQNNT